jgi:hypothetical protein
VNSSKEPPKLADLSVHTLEVMASVLAPKCQPPVIDNSDDLSTEHGRHQLAWKGGRHSVLKDVQDAIKAKQRGGG